MGWSWQLQGRRKEETEKKKKKRKREREQSVAWGTGKLVRQTPFSSLYCLSASQERIPTGGKALPPPVLDFGLSQRTAVINLGVSPCFRGYCAHLGTSP
jgi:hypothetical protein